MDGMISANTDLRKAALAMVALMFRMYPLPFGLRTGKYSPWSAV